MDYKFILMPYQGPGSRIACPHCGKKELSQYINTETGEIVHPTCGRCNRESSCAYHYTPKQYYQDHPSEKSTAVSYRYTPIQAIHSDTPQRPIGTIAPEVMERTVAQTLTQQGMSNFTKWLSWQFDQKTLERAIWERLVKEYNLGTAENQATVFWQVDSTGKIRTGQLVKHIITPDYMDCKRDHTYNNWMHKLLTCDGVLDKDFNMKQCLFGEHLLPKYPGKIVAVVEGQKNAAIGSGVNPNWTWVATCGKKNLNAEKLASLKGRRVLLIPDLDAHKEWAEKIPQIAQQIGFNYSIYDRMTAIATDADYAQGLDISDYLLHKFETQKQF